MDNQKDILNAINIVHDGGIIIFPTDTAFGIGCRLDKPEAITRLFSLRKRPQTQATPVLVSSIPMALQYFSDPTPMVKDFMERFWPGALTIVSSCSEEQIHPLVRGGGGTIGLRMPNHASILQIIESVGVPILGPSANFHGEKTPYIYEDLDPNLLALVDYVVPGECILKQASTVIQCTESTYTIIRQGAVTI